MRMLLLGKEGKRHGIWGNSEHRKGLARTNDNTGP